MIMEYGYNTPKVLFVELICKIAYKRTNIIFIGSSLGINCLVILRLYRPNGLYQPFIIWTGIFFII